MKKVLTQITRFSKMTHFLSEKISQLLTFMGPYIFVIMGTRSCSTFITEMFKRKYKFLKNYLVLRR